MLLFIVFYFTRPQCNVLWSLFLPGVLYVQSKVPKIVRNVLPGTACVASVSVGFSACSRHFSLFGTFLRSSQVSRVQKANLRKTLQKRLLRRLSREWIFHFVFYLIILTALGSLRNNFVFPMAHFVESKPAALRMKRQLSAGSPVQFCWVSEAIILYLYRELHSQVTPSRNKKLVRLIHIYLVVAVATTRYY